MSDNNQNKPSITYDSAITSSAALIAPKISLDQPDLALHALREGMTVSETRDCIEEVTGGKTEFSAEYASEIAEAYLKGAAALLKERRNNKSNLLNTQDSKTAKKLNDYSADDLNSMYSDFWSKK